MQISSIVDIINGELQNSPFISFITDIKIDPKKVKQGDLFLVQNQDDIPLAIQNGAFAILHQIQSIQIIDPEIAWIYVQDIDYALICLMRYILTHHDLSIYHCDLVSQYLIQLYHNDFAHNVVILEENMFENIIALNSIQEHCFIFSSNKTLLEQIYPDFESFNTHTYQLSNHIVHSAFETSFSHKQHYFDRLKIASIYIYQFLDIYYFLDGGIDMSKLKNLSFFKPIFINKSMQMVEFGKSDKFLIANENPHYYDVQIAFLKQIYSYAKIEIFDLEEVDVSQLRQILKQSKFNIGYIKGKNYEQIAQLLSTPLESTSLFE